MKLDFSLADVMVVEFGVGLARREEQLFVTVPIDASVQAALVEMVHNTWYALLADEEGPAPYEPSDKHASIEYLYVPLTDDLVTPLRHLHEATTLPIDSSALSAPADVVSYFCRLEDSSGSRITALRRATQFKGVLRSKNRLVRQIDDTLTVIEDTVFKLDRDFDVLVDRSVVHVLRPSGFEFAGKLQQAILDAVRENVESLASDLSYIDFGPIEAYARTRSRAARYLASIKSQEDVCEIDKALLKRLCKQTNVDVTEAKGVVTVATGHELAFLEVLDRRRYEVNLVRERPEQYRAASRRKLI